MRILVLETNDYKFESLMLLFKGMKKYEIIRRKSVHEALNEFMKSFHSGKAINLMIMDLKMQVYPNIPGSINENAGLILLKNLNKNHSEIPIMLYMKEVPENLKDGSEDAAIYNIIGSIPFPFDPEKDYQKFITTIQSIDLKEQTQHHYKPTNHIAKFEKVSFEQWLFAMKATFPTHEFRRYEMKKMYEKIQLPTRATTGSAGYDFKAPFSFELCPGTEILIPTGIRAVFVNMDWYLKLVPRSGCGVKTGIRLSNTEGIIDSDYFHANNEGHILAMLQYPENPYPPSHLHKWERNLAINHDSYYFEAGKGFVQGIFEMYGVTIDDDDYEKEDRWGGLGSTDEKNNWIPITKEEIDEVIDGILDDEIENPPVDPPKDETEEPPKSPENNEETPQTPDENKEEDKSNPDDNGESKTDQESTEESTDKTESETPSDPPVIEENKDDTSTNDDNSVEPISVEEIQRIMAEANNNK